ncbi:MAG: hypothetical protein J7521_20355 [Caulobacter sp.]|nr:hypothetical protein [Caulobacter sp.]
MTLAPIVPYVAGVMIALTAFGAVQTWRIGRLKFEANVAAGEIKALGEAKSASERLRDKEGQGATVSYEGLAVACAGRLPITIQAGRTLERITNAQPNPDGSRGMCDDQCVRELAGQAEPVAGALPR